MGKYPIKHRGGLLFQYWVDFKTRGHVRMPTPNIGSMKWTSIKVSCWFEGSQSFESYSKEPEREQKSTSKHSKQHKGAISECLLFRSPPLWAFNVQLLSLHLNGALLSWKWLRGKKKHLPNSLTII